jgi:polysaccharide pyruvyl transferase WcaK-like protein
MKAILFNDTSFDHHLGCQLVMRQIYEFSAKNDIQIMTVSPVKHKWHKDRALLKSVKGSDVVIVNGEGTLHSDNRRALRLIKIADYCLSVGKPCFLINALYFNNSEDMHKSVRKFTGVFVRDRQSQSELRQLGVEASYCPDLTLSIIPHVEHLPKDGMLVLDSNDSDVTEQLYRKYLAEEGSEFRSLLSRPKIQKGKNRRSFLIKSYFERYGFKVEKKMSQKKAHLDAKDIYALHRERNVNSMLEKVAFSKGIITGRFHGICYALVTKTPFLACAASTYKVQNLLKEVGLDDRFLPVSDLEVAKVPVFTDEELAKVDDFVVEARRLADSMFNDIAEKVGFH